MGPLAQHRAATRLPQRRAAGGVRRRPTLSNKPTSYWLESTNPSLHQTQGKSVVVKTPVEGLDEFGGAEVAERLAGVDSEERDGGILLAKDSQDVSEAVAFWTNNHGLLTITVGHSSTLAPDEASMAATSIEWRNGR